MYDLTSNRATYTEDIQWNQVSNLESSGHEAETLLLGHRGPVAFQLRKCTDLHDLAIAKLRIKQVLFYLEMLSLNRQRNHLPSHSLYSTMPHTSATTFSEASFSYNYRLPEDNNSRDVTNEDNDYTILYEYVI
ncbi:hypothetical protein AVEN_146775-1 [Araneus ventricosus]|uniref:Uncharacterized protein n=1 Tax=Araneus ventricosus TaxID=182803 RepID=A0A4Y2D733_ARAVE|nr:hypothetical protein AVEN_146775-1 [Araneus ventricosus]